MSIGKTTTRSATAGDIREYFGRDAPQTIRARVLEADGDILGVAGYYVAGGMAVVFSDNKESIPKIRIWREAVALMSSLTIPAICVTSEASAPFLERLGWIRVGASDAGEVYQWQP